MANLIIASVEFYFKGEKISASIELDLNALMKKEPEDQTLPNLYPLLATSINLDVYSYEYEMMQTEKIKLTSPNPLVQEHIIDGEFNLSAYKRTIQTLQFDEDIQKIIDTHFTQKELDQNPRIKDALVAASRLRNLNN